MRSRNNVNVWHGMRASPKKTAPREPCLPIPPFRHCAFFDIDCYYMGFRQPQIAQPSPFDVKMLTFVPRQDRHRRLLPAPADRRVLETPASASRSDLATRRVTSPQATGSLSGVSQTENEGSVTSPRGGFSANRDAYLSALLIDPNACAASGSARTAFTTRIWRRPRDNLCGASMVSSSCGMPNWSISLASCKTALRQTSPLRCAVSVMERTLMS